MPKRAKKIEPKEWYTLRDVLRMEMFPWCKSYWSARNIITQDRKNENILKVTITGEGVGTKYHLKGRNIIRFVKKWNAGTIKFKNK